jgi:hypothetical protein
MVILVIRSVCRSYKKQGAQLFGHLKHVENNRIEFDNNLKDTIQFGDGFSAQVKGGIDQFIAMTGIQVAAADQMKRINRQK